MQILADWVRTLMQGNVTLQKSEDISKDKKNKAPGDSRINKLVLEKCTNVTLKKNI